LIRGTAKFHTSSAFSGYVSRGIDFTTPWIIHL